MQVPVQQQPSRRGRIPGTGSFQPSSIRTSYRFVLFALGSLVVLSWFSFSDLLRSSLSYSGDKKREAFLDQLQQRDGFVSSIGKDRHAASPLKTVLDSVATALTEKTFKVVTHDTMLRTSAAHCALSTMNDNAWEGAMCSFKSLCYDPATKEFVFYRAIPEIAPPSNPVNLGKSTKFFPRIVDGSLPVPRYEADVDETWVLMELNGQSLELENFLRDDLFAWWLLSQHATWADLKTTIRPLNAGAGASISLTSDMKQWYEAMPFGPLTTVQGLQEHYGKYPICFPRAVAGLGSMTDHCLAPDHDFHEIKRPKMGVGVEAIPCATGRGPLYYRIREEMIAKMTGKGLKEIPRRNKSDRPLILFAEDVSTADFETAEALSRQRFKKAAVLRTCTSCLSPAEQLELALQVTVFVTKPTGPQSLAAHFLRKGAGVVLYERNQKTHTNFGLWNNLAYVRSRWVQEQSKLLDEIHVELEKSQQFM